MGFHTYDVSRAENLEDADRFRYVGSEELLGALGVSPDATVADLGSGTGFYTDVVAPHVARVYAVDVQAAMHDYYRDKGVPANVELVTAEVAELPLETDALDAAFSTMTFHEYASEASLAELARVVRPGGRVVTADWTRHGPGEAGPPTAERFGAGDCTTLFADAGFRIERVEQRHETMVVVARATQ